MTILDTTNDIVPNAPDGFTASAEEGGVALLWNDNSDNELGFEIHRSSESGGVWGDPLLITRTGQNEVSWLDGTAAPGTHYRYQLVAFTATQVSSAVFAEVTTPDGILLVGLGEKTKGKVYVTLTWTWSGSTVVMIHRRINGGPEEVFQSDPELGNTYVDDTRLKGAPELEYQVCLVGGACSNLITITF